MSGSNETPDAAINHLGIMADIVSSYLANNSVRAGDIDELIRSVHAALTTVSGGAPVEEEVKAPAVSIKKSITPEFLICLEDGKKFKAMKRHLSSVYGMTPDEYRAKWKLPSDYPMVAPEYAKKRSALAKATDLGNVAKQRPKPAPTRGRGRPRRDP